MVVSAELAPTLAEAAVQQERLARKVVMCDEPPFDGGLVTGVDVAYTQDQAVGCAVVMDLPRHEIVQITKVRRPCSAPYVPGFFHLREGPVIADLLRGMDAEGPILIDGNGILHPRRLGLASYMGVTMNRQTVGVAKTLLLGEIQAFHHDVAEIVDAEEVIGSALWLRNRKTPVFVSVGHRIALETALDVVRACSSSGFPEPLRKAHCIAKSSVNDYMGGEVQ
jgi:deoxyribonuclease V